MDDKESVVQMGRVAAPYGVKGWVRINSYAQPAENIFDYGPWRLHRQRGMQPVREVEVLEGKPHGKGLIARIAGIDDRDKAEELKGLDIFVARSELPQLDSGTYYWTDLEGLRVERADGTMLGRVDHMLEAGAADVMVVCGDPGAGGRYLIPFIKGEVILQVDLEGQVIQVDWEDEIQ